MENSEYRPKKRKKRSKFVRRMRAFLRNVAALPAKTLIVIGGTIAVILIAVILLVVLLPIGGREAEVAVETPMPAPTVTPTLPPLPTETPPPPTPTPHPLIGVGTEGRNGWYLQLNDQFDIVADIQTRLIELMYMEMPVIDGVAQVTTTYGPATKKAVQMFQAVNEIELDGCVGMDTFDLLMSENAKANRLSRGSDPYLFGDMTKKLHARLIELGYMKGTAGERYTEDTVKAVQQFQSANGLKPDGIAGRDTLQVIYTDAAISAKNAPAQPAAPSASPEAPEPTADPSTIAETPQP